MRRNGISSQSTIHVLFAFILLLTLATPQLGKVPTAQAADPLATTGQWGAVINWGIFGKHMAMMPNGKVLAWPTGQDAFVWDPVTQEKEAVPATFGDLHCAAQNFLPDGRVIVAGGVVVSPHDGTTVTAIFDPATNTWTNAKPMNYARWYGTSTRLADGRILVSSGDMPGGGRANIPEIYDAVSDTWTALPNTASKDLGLYPQMFVLPSGKVYKAGTSTATALLDTSSGTWLNGPTNAFGSSGYAESSAMYAPGKIIRSGGGDPSINNAASIDMTSGNPQWKQLQPMAHARRRHNMVILADGQVMAVGGTSQADDQSGAVYDGEIWNPATEQWTLTAPMTNDRMYHSTAMLLPDGRVLTAGGEYAGRYNAQIFSPPYLFKGDRPIISGAPSTMPYGTNVQVKVTITDASTIDSVVLIGLGAVTHAFDHNQRYVPLTFNAAGNILDVSAPANGNIAPPGYYMLVVKDSKGVPSVAKFVRVDTADNLIPGTVTGVISDGSNTPIEGATVSYAGNSAQTAADGSYTLANVNPGQVEVSIFKAGFATVKRMLEVRGGTTVTLDAALTPPGTISGKITNSDTHKAISGAIVTYEGGTVTTAADGTYTIEGLPSGGQGQVMNAVATGYNSSTNQNVVVPANDTVVVDIALTPKPTFIAGEVRDTVTGGTVANATVSTGSVTVHTDSAGRYQLFVPPGTYTLTTSMTGYTDQVIENVIITFGSYTAVDPLITPINPPLTFTPLADTYTSSADPSGQTKNYGTANTFRAATLTPASPDTNPTMNSYLRFTVTGVTRAVESAKLRMYVSNGSDKGGTLFSITDTYSGTTTPWTESGLNWNNAPAITGTPVASVNTSVSSNNWVEFDVTALVNDNGTFDFALTNSSINDVRYASRETTTKPQLVIQQSDHLPLTSVTDVDPISGPVGTPVIISGTGLQRVLGVTFNGTAASFSVLSSTQLRVVVPNGATSGRISVNVPNDTLNLDAFFNVTVKPPDLSISQFAPAKGPIGTEVAISGTGFGEITSVLFNGKPASSFTIDSGNSLRAIVPAGATSGKITLITPTQQSVSSTNFVVTSANPQTNHQLFVPLMMKNKAIVAPPKVTRAQYTALSASLSTVTSNAFVCRLGLE